MVDLNVHRWAVAVTCILLGIIRSQNRKKRKILDVQQSEERVQLLQLPKLISIHICTVVVCECIGIWWWLKYTLKQSNISRIHTI